MKNLNSIFITGGTGTLGSLIIERVLKDYPNVKNITIYSRDEMKQYEMRRRYPANLYPVLKWIIGDVRDAERLESNMSEVDLVIHAAAMKHILICEENPEECLKTNVQGTKNVIAAAKTNKVPKIILCSTDKAVDPISIYGNSKQAAEKLFIKANSDTSKFSIIRFGNLFGSRGSVVPLFEEEKENGVLPLTHPEMSRFFCQPKETVDTLLLALDTMLGGEIFIPKMRAIKIIDLATHIAPSCTHKIIGLRGFEKIHEKLVSEIEEERTLEQKQCYIITQRQMTNDEALDHYQALALREVGKLDSANFDDKSSFEWKMSRENQVD
jgi:FlaA1/EpsC-like NDP-sugar epimerase